MPSSCDDPGGGRGPDPLTLENHKVIGFPSNTGPDPHEKIEKLPSQHSMLGHHRPASETPASETPDYSVFVSSLSPHQLIKNAVRVGPSLAHTVQPDAFSTDGTGRGHFLKSVSIELM